MICARCTAKLRLSIGEPVISGGLGFSVDLRPENGDLVGYRAKPHTGVIDLAKLAHYDPQSTGKKCAPPKGGSSSTPVRSIFWSAAKRSAIPPTHAAEMAPYLAMVGEFRVHYAGFFDPGFGWAEAGGAGSRGVLRGPLSRSPVRSRARSSRRAIGL